MTQSSPAAASQASRTQRETELRAPIIKVENLEKTYRTARGELTLFRGLDLEVRAGEMLAIDGALTATRAAELVRVGERRQIVVADPTRIAFGGRAFIALAGKLDLRCRRPLRLVGCVVAPRGAERAFEPRSFLEEVARATALPTFDVYAGSEAA